MFGSFKTVDELWATALQYVFQKGDQHSCRDDRTMREVLGAQLRLKDTHANILCSAGRMMSPCYAAGELLWYLAGTDSGDHIMHYAKSYRHYLEPIGIAYGAYGPRIFDYENVLQIVQLLRERPNTRRAVLLIWRPSDLPAAVIGKVKDIPCTMCLQFIIRNGKLNCITTMRSNDIWLGMPYDIFCFSMIQNIIANYLDIPTGFYQHNVGSLHLYKEDFEDADLAIQLEGEMPASFKMEEPKAIDFIGDLLQVRNIEQGFRIMKDINLGSFTLLNKTFGPYPSRWAFLLALTLLHSAEERPTTGEISLFRDFIPEKILRLAFIRKQKKWGVIEL